MTGISIEKVSERFLLTIPEEIAERHKDAIKILKRMSAESVPFGVSEVNDLLREIGVSSILSLRQFAGGLYIVRAPQSPEYQILIEVFMVKGVM